MRLFLDIPFGEEENIKNLGAKFDKGCNKWYIDRNMYNKFKKYILDIEEYAEHFILKDYFYIIISPYKCQNCDKGLPPTKRGNPPLRNKYSKNS